MTEHPHSLAFVFEGWNDFQRNLLDAVTPLSAEQLALPVAWDHWSLADLVRHIAADRAWWFHVWMGEGGTTLPRWWVGTSRGCHHARPPS